MSRLKTKSKVNSVAKVTSIPVDYLTVLRRVVNSYHPEPRKIRDFPCLSESIKAGLENIGIKNAVELYNQIATGDTRDKLKKGLNITDEETMLMVKLTDVSPFNLTSSDSRS